MISKQIIASALLLTFLAVGCALTGVSPPGADVKHPIPVNEQTGRFFYTGIVEVPGISKTALHRRAKAWVAKGFGSAADVLKLDDLKGSLIIKGQYQVPFKIGKYAVFHTLTIDLKDGRYRYTLTDLEVMSLTIGGVPNSPTPLEDGSVFRVFDYREKFLSQVNENVRSTIASLRQAMSSGGTAGDKNW
jgi:hypothetical protein